jgi:hypothetical protein
LLLLLMSLPAWIVVELFDVASAQALQKKKEPPRPERVIESSRWSAGA